MRIPSAKTATSDERLLAAVAHGSVILFGWGAVAAIVIWIVQRQKSAFVSFHALQALTFQLLQTIFWLMVVPVMVIVMICGLSILPVLAGDSSSRASPAFALVPLLMGGTFFCAYGLPFLLGIVAAVYVLTGHDFYYPLIGRRMERYLDDDSLVAPAETI